MLQVTIKVCAEPRGAVYRLEIYQNSRFVRLLKAKSPTELANAVTADVSRFANKGGQADRSFCLMRVMPVPEWWLESQQFLNPVSAVGLIGEVQTSTGIMPDIYPRPRNSPTWGNPLRCCHGRL